VHTNLIHRFYQSIQAIQRLGIFLRARSRAYAYVLLTSVFLVLVASPMLAGAITQGYDTTDKTITIGMAVAVASTQGTGASQTIIVEKSSVKDADKTLGIVVNPQSDTVAVSANGSQVYVATTGAANVYVSDINGTIHKNDLLAASPVQGVLMRADDGTKGILGIAQDNFPTTGTQKISVKNNTGQIITAKVAMVRINMDVKFSTSTQPSTESSLQRLGKAIVHHQVSQVKVFLSLGILTMVTVVVGGVVYAAISSSMISLGRNPFARKTILHGLNRVIALMVLVLLVGLAAVYMVLWI
jgi:hypothetical protein